MSFSRSLYIRIARYPRDAFLKNLLVDRDLRYAYLQIPKASCSSVKYFLISAGSGSRAPITQRELHDNREHWIAYGHSEFVQRIETLGEAPVIGFTVVRNPYTRILSAYREKIELRKDSDRFRKDLGLPVRASVSFADFLFAVSEKEPLLLDHHFMPMSMLLPEDLRACFRLGSTESLAADLRGIAAEIGLPSGIGTRRDSHRTDSSSMGVVERYYRAREQEMVLQIYGEDFRSFGYSASISACAQPPISPSLAARTPVSSIKLPKAVKYAYQIKSILA